MAESSSRRARRTDPLSFYISDLYTVTETDTGPARPLRLSLERITEENSSNRSTGYLTALPKLESVFTPPRRLGHSPRAVENVPPRKRIYVPLPLVPRSAFTRTESQSPILEKDALSKDTGVLDRSESERSRIKSRVPIPPAIEQPRRRRRLICILAIIIFLVVLAIILGTVLTIYLTPNRSSPSPTFTQGPVGTSPTPTQTPTPTTPTVAPGGEGNPHVPLAAPRIASVAVAGWNVPGSNGDSAVWLFWQDSEGYLSRAAFNSSTGNWTWVNRFAEAREGTPLAATAWYVDWYAGQDDDMVPRMQYQAGVVYLDDENYLNEWVFPDSGPENGQPGPLNQQEYVAHEDTKIAAYWPHIVYQGMAGEMRGVHYACHEENECWHERVFSTTKASNGTQLVVTPLQNNLSSLGLFYHEEGGRFLEYAEDEEAVGSLWENSAFSNLVPPNASVAAFSTTRSTSSTDPKLNTYLLWQDANNTIQMSWTDNDVGWQGPVSYPAFAGAEPDTALACLTGLTFPHFPLQSGTELARCYFQTGRALREISFDGGSWDIVGVIHVDV